MLSGFIIMHVHMIDLFKPERIKGFVLRRCVRIYPIYWIIFAGVFFVALIVPSLRGTVPVDFLVIKALTLMPLELSVLGKPTPVLVVAWTLQYELYFYILFCLAILNRWVAFIVFSLLAIGLLLGLGNGNFPANFIWSDWIILFFFGALVAVLVRSHKEKIPNALIIIAISFAILAVTVGMEPVGSEGKVSIYKLSYGFGFAGLILGFIVYEHAGRSLPWFIQTKVVQRIGDASYFLYLVHFPVISFLCKLALNVGLKGVVGASIAFIVIASACVLISIAGHSLIERPLQMWLSRTLIPRRALVPAL